MKSEVKNKEVKVKTVKNREGKTQIWVKNEKLAYEKELAMLQVELLKFQNHVKDKGLKILMIFEGRDAAGKGGTIKRITEHLNPRGARVVALEKPSDKETSQWYFQRYVPLTNLSLLRVVTLTLLSPSNSSQNNPDAILFQRQNKNSLFNVCFLLC